MSRYALLLASLALLAFAIYARTFTHDIALDDRDLLEATPSFTELFFERHEFEDTGYYRPVADLTYLALHAFVGSSVRVEAAHLQNAIFYAVAVALLFHLCVVLLGRGDSALAASFAVTALFALHPLHTESVAWISARPDVLVLMWIVASILTYRRYQQMASTWWLAASAFFALLSFLTKEAGVAVLPILIAFEAAYPARAPAAAGNAPHAQVQAHRRRRRAPRAAAGRTTSARSLSFIRGRAALAFAIATAIYIGMRLIAFDGHLTSSDADGGALWPEQLFGAIGFYTERLFVPRDFLAYYASVPDSPRNIAIGVLATLAWLAAFALAVRMRQRAVAVGLVWTAATLAPSLPVVVANASIAPVAERYVFLPSAGLAICLASIFLEIARRITEATPRIRIAATAGAAFICVALAAVFALQTNQRIGDWRDLETLLEATIDDAPEAGIPHVYLAHVHARAGRIDETRVEFLAATVGEMPDVSRHAVWYEYAAWLDANGFPEESWAAYRQAIALDPRSVLVRRDFAASLWRYATRDEMHDGRMLASALAEAELAVEIDPERVETLVLLATIARDLGDTTRARSAFEQALKFEDSDDIRQRIRLQLDSLPE